MSKVTSKLQVTIPKAIAVKYGIRPGDQVVWEETPRGVTMIRIPPGGEGRVGEGSVSARYVGPGLLTAKDLTPEERVAHFKESTRRIQESQKGKKFRKWTRKEDRGWTREDLYGDRGSPR
jgi:AbrB family looped-hinge helix DNA binding protein